MFAWDVCIECGLLTLDCIELRMWFECSHWLSRYRLSAEYIGVDTSTYILVLTYIYIGIDMYILVLVYILVLTPRH